MRAVRAWNLGGLAVAVAASIAPTLAPGASSADRSAKEVSESSSAPLVDHGGFTAPRRRFERIVSASTVADALLVELCEPDRIVAFTSYSAEKSYERQRFAGKPVIADLKSLEAVLLLRPDLVLVGRLGDPRPVARLREAGLVVYDLGEARGLSTLSENIREVAALVGHPERGETLQRVLVTSMKALGASVAPASRKRGLYLSAYGGHLYGGAAGTNYHDVLTSAGLVDAARGARDWPEYSIDEVLAKDPDVIVTNKGMRERICEAGALARLRACRDARGIAEIDDALLDDPGPLMLDAAVAVRRAVYGDAPE